MSLRHDKALHTVKLQDHLSDVPDYMVPNSLKEFIQNQEADSDKGTKKKDKDYYKKKLNGYKKYQTKKKNPLVGMEYTGLKKT